jgi:prepilin-type N-terminal cleavage/methylation domain-containing protein
VVTRRGFTMLELLLVLAIVGILLGIGSVGVARYLNQLKINEAMRTVIDAINQASNEALRSSRELTFSTNTAKTRLRWQEGSTTIGQKDLPKSATVTITRSIGNQTPSFTARGLPTQQLALTVQRGSDTRTLTLLVTGLVIQQ